jgi:hypothetical protein
MEAWGNKRANEYYENKLPSADMKPTETHSVATVTRFITGKIIVNNQQCAVVYIILPI